MTYRIRIPRQREQNKHDTFEFLEVAYRIVHPRKYSGDHCEAVRYNKHRYGLVVADSSKLYKPAQEMVRGMCKDLFRKIRDEKRTPKQSLQDLAKEYANPDEKFVTLLYVDVLMRGNRGMMSIYRAAHEHVPIYISAKTHKSRRIRRPSSGVLPIGLTDYTHETRLESGELNTMRAYEPKHITIKPGDIVALFTDGLTDAKNKNGDDLEYAGLEKVIKDLVIKNKMHKPDEIIETAFKILDETHNKETGYHFRDDSSLMIAKIL